MKTFKIYWHDLTEEAQERLFDLYHDNIELSPISIIELEDEVDYDLEFTQED